MAAVEVFRYLTLAMQRCTSTSLKVRVLNSKSYYVKVWWKFQNIQKKKYCKQYQNLQGHHCAVEVKNQMSIGEF